MKLLSKTHWNFFIHIILPLAQFCDLCHILIQQNTSLSLIYFGNGWHGSQTRASKGTTPQVKWKIIFT